MFKVYVKTDKSKPAPKDDIYYIIAKNGTFIHKKTKFIEAIVPVKGIPWLEHQEKKATILLPRIPLELMAITLNFFEEVYSTFRSEAVILLHYSEEENMYLIDAPQQEVSGASVEYQAAERFEGYQLVGTIHNHSNFGAFHSGVDDTDEKHFDGVHITTGNIDSLNPTISVSVVVNGTRFKFQPEKIIEGIELIEAKPFKFNKKKKKHKRSYGYLYQNQNIGYHIQNKFNQEFQLNFPEGKSLIDYPFDPDWMDMVEKEKIVVYNAGKRVNWEKEYPESKDDYLNEDLNDPSIYV